jgi:hypothetical protein
LLLKWHRQDPVSQKEIDRNNAAYAFQGNRNPFIDNPAFADSIWDYKGSQSAINDDIQQPEISIYPNPVNDILYINTTVFNSVEIYDIAGKKIEERSINTTSKGIDVSTLNKGTYILKISGTDITMKFVKL